MKREFILLPILSLFILSGCNRVKTNKSKNNEDKSDISDTNSDTDSGSDETTNSMADYAAFLGRDNNNIDGFEKYKYVAFDFETYDKSTIDNLKTKNINCFAYLNMGAIEEYRSYYSEYKNLGFALFEEWPDEHWVDITAPTWQTFIHNFGSQLLSKGAYGVYLDNVDVYSVAIEKGKNNTAFASAICLIIDDLNSLGLKVMMNGGSEFLDDMIDQKNSIVKKVWGYHQEEVFSMYDFDEKKYTVQNSEDSKYYQQIAAKMKQNGTEIFFSEYTNDDALKSNIGAFCNKLSYHYYIASNIDLN